MGTTTARQYASFASAGDLFIYLYIYIKEPCHLKQSVIRELPIDDGIFIAKLVKMPRIDWEHFLIL